MSIFSNGETPAHPVDCAWDDGEVRGTQTGNRSGWAIGLTKREHLAAMAMQGFCACPHAWEEKNAVELAAMAAKYADALLLELAKK